MTDVVSQLNGALEGRYRIERELGSGGMATVYLAEDLRHDRKVALKVLNPELAAVLGADRFVAEIKTTASLQHPHILPLFDSGTAGGFLYYVMPNIEGETLRDRLNRETQLGIEDAVRITTEVADALDYAHRHGVIHRDIKPENILLHEGRPVVADFGIALAVSAAAGGRMTETGLSLGTPHYMSPEQATAEKDITRRSDIYSLASVLYEMLTGEPPFLGNSAQQIIMKIVTDTARPVTELRKSVPPNVAAAVAVALEKLPADRFASAKAFADALENPAFAVAARGGAGATAPTRRWMAALVAGLVIGTIAGGAAVEFWRKADSAVVERGREQLTFNGQSEHPAISPDGDLVAYVTTACEHARTSNCRSSLLVQEIGGTQPIVLIADALSLATPRWTHDGETIIVGGELDAERAGLFAVPRLSGTAQLIGPRGTYDTHAAADSVLLVPFRPGQTDLALVIDPGSGTVLDSVNLPVPVRRDISWAPDGRHFAANTATGIHVIDLEGRTTASLSGRIRSSIRWNADGTALLFFRPGTVWEDDFQSVSVSRNGEVQGDPEVIMRRVPTLMRGEFDIARHTGQLVIGTGDAATDIFSFELAERPVRVRRETRGTTWYGDPTVSHDGNTIFYLRGDAFGDNAYALDRITGTEAALTAQRLPGGNATRLSPDGRRLTFGLAADSLTQLQVVEFPSRRVLGSMAAIQTTVVPLQPRGFLALTMGGKLTVLDSLGGVWRNLPVPDSLVVEGFAASPDGSQAVILATPTYHPALSVRAGTAPRSRAVIAISLETGDLRTQVTLDTDEPTPGLAWDVDGTVYLGRWRTQDDTPSVWRFIPGDGELEHVADLAADCTPQTIQVGALGRVAVCVVDDFRSDIWFIDVERLSR